MFGGLHVKPGTGIRITAQGSSRLPSAVFLPLLILDREQEAAIMGMKL